MSRTRPVAMMVFALFVAIGMAAAGAETKPSLDGKTFAVQLVKGDAKSGDPDTLTFSKGMFDSSACHHYGFGQSAYTAKPEGQKLAFEVHAANKTGDKQIWNGTVDGNRIHGTMKSTDSKGVVTTYRFKGDLRTS